MKKVILYALAILTLFVSFVLRKCLRKPTGLNEKVQTKEDVLVVLRGPFGKKILKTR